MPFKGADFHGESRIIPVKNSFRSSPFIQNHQIWMNHAKLMGNSGNSHYKPIRWLGIYEMVGKL